MSMNDRLNPLRHRYHAFKAAVREQLKLKTTNVRLPRGSRFAIPRVDEIAERIANGTYEIDVVRFLGGALKPGMVAFDLGAHCGYFTLLMREAVGADGQVHSFEPSPRTYRRLTANVRRNGYSNVFARESAVGSQVGSLTLNTYNNSRAAYATLGTPPFPDSIAARVPVTTLDLYSAQPGIGQVDLVKMDVEGSELEVLKGARQLLESRRLKVIVFEASDATLASRGTNSAAVLDYLRQLNYSLFDLNDDGGLMPISQQASYIYHNLVAVAPGAQIDVFIA